MDTTRNQSESMEIRLTDANGQKRTAAHINYTIRPGQGFNINFDIFDKELVDANAAAVGGAVKEFVTDAMQKACAAGIPVCDQQETEDA